MKQSIFQEKYPIFSLELDKAETNCESVDEIIAALKQKIEDHPAAQFIAIFDHYSHTKALPDGIIGTDMVDAKNLVFCFGIKLPNPAVMAVRPRSIGVTQTARGFVVNFMEAPMPQANTAMEAWALSLKNR
jgi:hypothetical protein